MTRHESGGRGPSLLAVWAYVFLAVWWGVPCVLASHFRGGTINWKSMGGNKVHFYYRLGWVLGRGPGCTTSKIGQLVTGHSDSWVCQSNNCGTTNLHDTNYICAAADAVENWEQGYNDFTYTFPGTGPFTIAFNSGDWITTSNGKGGGNWNLGTIVDLRTRSDTAAPNSSPASLSKPLYTVQFNCEVRLKIPVEDADDDVTRCRWAQGGECASVCSALPFARLDEETCTLVFNTTAANSYVKGGIYAVAISIEDFPRVPMTLGGSVKKTPSDALSIVPVQFLLKTIPVPGPCDAGPRFVPPTPEDKDVITVEEGDKVVVGLFADNGNDTSSKANRITASGPPGMTTSPVIPDKNRTNTFTTDVTWMTSHRDIGNHIVCGAVANDKGKNGEQRCFTIKVVPKGCKSSPCQNSGKCVANMGNYTCICRPGYTGKNCEVDVDDCVSNPCPSGTACVDGINTYVCSNVTTTPQPPTTTEKNYTGMCPLVYDHCDCTIRPGAGARGWMGLSRIQRDVLDFTFGIPIGLILSTFTFFCLLRPCERHCDDDRKRKRGRKYNKM